MSNIHKIILLGIFDIAVGFLFVASNWWIWSYLSGKITANVWGPLQIAIVPKTIVDGQATTIGTFLPVPNYPFILFWVALVGNFIFFVLALRSSNKKQSSG